MTWNPIDWVKSLLGKWSLKTAAGKVIKRGVVIAAAWLLSLNIGGFDLGDALIKAGMTPEALQQFMAVFLWGILEGLRNFLKTRFGWSWL